MRLVTLSASRFAIVAAFALAVLAAPFTARAVDEGAAREHVADVYGALVDIAVNGGGVAAQKEAFRAVLVTDIAYEEMARLSMGSVWRAMSEGQKSRFTDAFLTYIVETYASRFADFDGEELSVGDIIDANGDEVLIDSAVVTTNGSRDTIQVIWHLIEIDGEPKVLDVLIEGVSLRVTAGGDFAAILERNGDDIDGLIDQMQAVGDN